MDKGFWIALGLAVIITAPAMADDSCDDVLEDIQEELAEFDERSRTSAAERARFMRELRSDLDPRERGCPGINFILSGTPLLAASLTQSDDEDDDRDRRRRGRDDDEDRDDRETRRMQRMNDMMRGYRGRGREDRCEDVVEDIRDELEDFEEDREDYGNSRARFIRYILADLDRKERRCAALVFDGDKDVSPHMLEETWDPKSYSRRWDS